MILMPVLDVTGISRRGRLKKSFYQIASGNVRMPVFAREFWNDRPDALGSSNESILQRLDGWGADRRTIDQSDDGSVATAVENFLQADLQGAELSAAGVGVAEERGAIRISVRCQSGFIFAGNDDHKIGRKR